MVLDTSAILAILQDEPDRRRFNELIESADRCMISAANLVECSVVLTARYGEDGVHDLDLFLARAMVTVEDVTEVQARVARRAYETYGKGRHPAGLNFGDCFSYALAKVNGDKLLYKGDDFAKTDIESAAGIVD